MLEIGDFRPISKAPEELGGTRLQYVVRHHGGEGPQQVALLQEIQVLETRQEGLKYAKVKEFSGPHRSASLFGP